MSLSKNTVSVLVDLIENKLAMMEIGDRNELREVLTLQRCLAELKGAATTSLCDLPDSQIPARGRRRKLAALMQDLDVSSSHDDHRVSA